MPKNIHRGFQIYQIMESLHYFDVFDNPRKVTTSAFQHCQGWTLQKWFSGRFCNVQGVWKMKLQILLCFGKVNPAFSWFQFSHIGDAAQRANTGLILQNQLGKQIRGSEWQFTILQNQGLMLEGKQNVQRNCLFGKSLQRKELSFKDKTCLCWESTKRNTNTKVNPAWLGKV